MVRPLSLQSGNLQEMTDANLDRLLYYLRVAYASQLAANGDGYVSVGGSTHTVIGTASDTSSTQQMASNTRNGSTPGVTGYPSAPGIGSETDATFTWQQDQSFPAFPAGTVHDAYGYVHYTSGGEIRTASDEADVYADLISQCITDIKTGDEVGSYRVSTGAPTSGGAGTWDDKGTFYTDTTYSNGSTVYKLWLKRSLNSVPGSDIFPLGLDGSNLKERTIIESSNLVQNVLLPALTRRIFYGGATGDLNYTVGTSAGGTSKGTFTDTKQTATTNTNQFSDPYYRTYSTPSGSSVTQTTYYFNLS